MTNDQLIVGHWSLVIRRAERAVGGCTMGGGVSREPELVGPDTHPTGFWFFFWGEFAERCSYYGMRAILPLYMTQRLLLSDDQAAEWYSYFKAACYLLPLLGGYLADHWFGKYRTIVAFSVPYVLGQFLIGLES